MSKIELSLMSRSVIDLIANCGCSHGIRNILYCADIIGIDATNLSIYQIVAAIRKWYYNNEDDLMKVRSINRF